MLISERGPCLQDKATWEQNSKSYHSNRKDKQDKTAKGYFTQGGYSPPVACAALKTEEASLQNRKVSRRNRCPVCCSQSCCCCTAPHISVPSAELFQVPTTVKLHGLCSSTDMQVVPAATFPTTAHLGRFKITIRCTCRLPCSCSSHLPACLPVTGLPLPLLTGTCAPCSLPAWKGRQYCATKRACRSVLVGQACHRSPSSPWMA